MPLLQELNLSGCTLLTDATAEALATLSFPSLRRLEMIGCTSLEDEGVRLLAEGLPTLQALDISSCRLLTDVGLRWIGEGMGNLEVIQSRAPFAARHALRVVQGISKCLEPCSIL